MAASHPPPLTAPLSSVRFAAIDFESAGSARGATDVPIQVGIACSQGTEVVPAAFFTSYLAADRPVTWAAQKVHGIRSADLAGAPTMASLWPDFKRLLGGAAVVAHGAGTEKRFLRTFPLHGFGPWIDTLSLSRKAFPELPDHSLGTISDHLGVTRHTGTLCPDRGWHDALFDAVASLLVLHEIIACFGLADRPLHTLGT